MIHFMLEVPGLYLGLEAFPWALFAAMAAGLAFASRYHQARPRERYDAVTQTAIIEPLYMPLLLAIVIPLSLALSSGAWEGPYLWLRLAQICLTTGLYFTGLAVLNPLLRRFVSARGRAALWLLPNMLYILIFTPLFQAGAWVIQIPRSWIGPGLTVWGIGVASTMLWHVLSHLRFRKSLLSSAAPELADPAQTLWYRACTAHKVRTDIPLMRSAAVETPLSVGCFQKTMVLVLPNKDYTPEELTLIYRHELRHIKRADMRTKIWMALWKSVLWFFPPVWWAAKITAEDLELCCDEEVLTGAEPEERRRYAALLLDSTAPAAGFSTCLSADARALARRLRQAVAPKAVLRGDWIVGITAGLLLMFTLNLSVGITEDLASALPRDLTLESVWFNGKELPLDQTARDALDQLLTCSYIQLNNAPVSEGWPVRFECSLPGTDRTVTVSSYSNFVWVYVSDRYTYDKYFIPDPPDFDSWLRQFV